VWAGRPIAAAVGLRDALIELAVGARHVRKGARRMMRGRISSRRWRTTALLAVGVAVGIMLVAQPAGANFLPSISHIWSHIKPKADVRYANAVSGTDTARNADRLDGYHVNQLVRATTATSTAVNDSFDTCAFTTLLSKSVTAPRKGILMVWGTIEAARDSDDPDKSVIQARATVDGSAATTVQQIGMEFLGQGDGSLAVSGAVPVLAGARTVALQAQECTAGVAFIRDKSLTTLFVPFGNDGAAGALRVMTTPRAVVNNN